MQRWAVLALVTLAYACTALSALAWSGVLVGPPLFGLVLEATGSYGPAWLLLAALGVVVAVVLVRLQPLVQRGPA